MSVKIKSQLQDIDDTIRQELRNIWISENRIEQQKKLIEKSQTKINQARETKTRLQKSLGQIQSLLGCSSMKNFMQDFPIFYNLTETLFAGFLDDSKDVSYKWGIETFRWHYNTDEDIDVLLEAPSNLPCLISATNSVRETVQKWRFIGRNNTTNLLTETDLCDSCIGQFPCLLPLAIHIFMKTSFFEGAPMPAQEEKERKVLATIKEEEEPARVSVSDVIKSIDVSGSVNPPIVTLSSLAKQELYFTANESGSDDGIIVDQETR